MVKLIIEDFGEVNNEKVKKFTWVDHGGFSLSAISYGCIIQAIKLPDKYGSTNDIVLGFDDLNSYVKRNVPYLGAAIGRCANRIGKASFTIDGQKYDLAANVKPNHLHGGLVGFDKKVWKTTMDGTKVTFSYLSKNMEEGYPGDLITNVTYNVVDWKLHMKFQSVSTEKTVINLTNHSYFNLAGHETGAAEIYNHTVNINADKITETDADSTPTGRLIPVGGTPYDLRTARRLGDVIEASQSLFDDNFCVNTLGEKVLTFVARASHPPSGRYMEIHCNQPGVQLYTANFLPSPDQDALIGKDGEGYRRHGAFCLETQNYPDAVHHENFPSPVLTPGAVYEHDVVYSFGLVSKDDRVHVVAS